MIDRGNRKNISSLNNRFDDGSSHEDERDKRCQFIK